MEIHVTLKQYLLRLEASELDKPEENRREVPTLQDLADVAGVTRASMSYLANNLQTRVNLGILSAVVQELRRRGFDVEITDLFELRNSNMYEGKAALTNQDTTDAIRAIA